MQKILIASRWCSPERNPRAFRTTELLDEFINRGYEVTAFLPDNARVHDKIRHIKVATGKIDYGITCVVERRSNRTRKYLDKLKSLFGYFFGDGIRSIKYGYWLRRLLKKHLRSVNDYDVIISISYPFYVNVAIACLKKYINPSAILIADCGDPFYANPSLKKVFYLKYLEKWTLQQFDYVTIPIEDAKSNYLEYLPEKRIKVIPQGFKIMDILPGYYQKNSIPIFGYAGVFYKEIRNPRYFFNYLLVLKLDFRFVVYALNDSFTNDLLAEYKGKLGDKLDIRDAVDREKLIPQMATWDFVINFDNDNSNQRPSKLIDYSMSKRPILSFNKATFNPDTFNDFLQGNYDEQERIDLSQYDIRTVVDNFEKLFAKKGSDKR